MGRPASRWPRAEEFLSARGADRTAHPGGTLLEHLHRVAHLLSAWGADPDAQLAGLCRAAYGTDGFDGSLLGTTERGVLAELIGDRASSGPPPSQRVLGMRPVTFGDGRRALSLGSSKINLHRAGRELVPHAARPTPGSADLCLVTEPPQERVLAHLAACGVPVEEGPVPRTGALGPILSTYLRDPDGNLIEISTYT
ncbi:VOC family protein [Streptomyces bungoensis]|uniref:VOC family protein n=1 Tax=Streptomyces bungoensis TaxID=285568 RepID=UPI00099E8CA3|nr:VOC family protein [Streptomyces bungoensis]